MMEGSHGQGTSALLLLLRTRRKARTQHGGRETTLFTIITKLLHFGMAVVFAGQMKVDEITGGTPYGATTIAGPDAQRQPSQNELAAARYQRRAIAQAEHDLLADLRRARRSLRHQDMDEPPAVARLTSGQRIADAVATVLGSWTFIIIQSAILFVWITANLVGAMRGWDPLPVQSSQSRAFAPGSLRHASHHDEPEPAGGH